MLEKIKLVCDDIWDKQAMENAKCDLCDRMIKERNVNSKD